MRIVNLNNRVVVQRQTHNRDAYELVAVLPEGWTVKGARTEFTNEIKALEAMYHGKPDARRNLRRRIQILVDPIDPMRLRQRH